VETLGRRRVAAAVIALPVAAVDLAYKAASPSAFRHDRWAGSALLMVLVAVALVLVATRLPSAVAAVGAGAAAGGALGNAVSLIVWSGVPDPLVVRGSAGGVAFNLADVFAVAGDAVLLASAAVYAVRNRTRLREPV
jgi:lipoprotein signal peptidase